METKTFQQALEVVCGNVRIPELSGREFQTVGPSSWLARELFKKKSLH